MTPAAASALAVALGVLAGVLFAWLWLRIVPWIVHRRFWSAMHPVARGLLEVEDLRRFGTLYRSLLALVARYVGRNLGGTIVASLPVLAVLLAMPRVLEERAVPFVAAFTVAMLAGFVWPSLRRS